MASNQAELLELVKARNLRPFLPRQVRLQLRQLFLLHLQV